MKKRKKKSFGFRYMKKRRASAAMIAMIVLFCAKETMVSIHSEKPISPPF
jgi:hypothetical protein